MELLEDRDLRQSFSRLTVNSSVPTLKPQSALESTGYPPCAATTKAVLNASLNAQHLHSELEPLNLIEEFAALRITTSENKVVEEEAQRGLTKDLQKAGEKDAIFTRGYGNDKVDVTISPDLENLASYQLTWECSTWPLLTTSSLPPLSPDNVASNTLLLDDCLNYNSVHSKMQAPTYPMRKQCTKRTYRVRKQWRKARPRSSIEIGIQNLQKSFREAQRAAKRGSRPLK